MSPVHSTRLLVIAAAIELATGICLSAFPGDLSAALYGPLLPVLPRLTAALVAGGVLLLIGLRYGPGPWAQRALTLGASAPILSLAYLILRSGGLTGTIAYLGLAAGIVAASWVPRQSEPRQGGREPDLFNLTLGTIQLAVGLLFLLARTSLTSPAFDPIRRGLPAVGLLGVACGLLLLGPLLRLPVPPTWQHGCGGLLPTLLFYCFARSGAWTGVVMWSIWGAGSLLGPALRQPGWLQPDRAEEACDDPDQNWSAQTLQNVEGVTWLLTLLVVTITSLVGPGAAAALPNTFLFVLLAGGFNLLFWLLPIPGSARFRLNLQLLVLALAVSLLLSAPIVRALLPLLLAIPMITARAGGTLHGYGMLVAVLAIQVLSRLALHDAEGSQLPQLAAEVAMLGAIGAALVRGAASHRALFRQLSETSRHLCRNNRELQAANAALEAQREELASQQDELLRQHRTLVEQAMVLSAQRDELLESEGRFRTAFERAPIGIALVGLDLVIMRANPALHAMLGYRPPELTGLSIRQITHPDDIRAQSAVLEAVQSGRSEGYTMEKRYLHRSGTILWVSISLGVVRDPQGSPLYFVTQVMDVTERKQTEEQLQRMADYDPLTDLGNRRFFQREVEAALARCDETGGALLFLDFDQFKFVNDTLGHMAGDDLLRGLARVLTATLDGRGTVARLGGDEFGILISGAGATEAEEIATRVLGAVRSHMEVMNNQPVGVTVSIGIALYPAHGRTVEELMLRADLAMYQAKQSGRDRYRIFMANGPEAEMGAWLNWERRIREALAEDRFTLVFQPILDLHRNEVIQYEALLRMVDRDGTLIPPGAFLRVAESYGLMRAIDRWVVRRAIQTIAEQKARGREINLSVNLSGQALSDPELLPLIKSAIAAHQVAPASLRFEITESAAVADLEQASGFIAALTELGCQFALDDFGAGFSSLLYLKRLPVRYLKIDGGFIERLPEDPVDQNLVKAVVTMAQGLGIQTVAEYVGSDQTIALLRQCGVDAAQGFLVGRPGPLPE